jgi:hypothetical protein
MNLAEWFRRLFHRGPKVYDPRLQEQLVVLRSALEDGSLSPPSDVHNSTGWDYYWLSHKKHGFLAQTIVDALTSDPNLTSLLTKRGSRTILCAGNGVSKEAISLSLLGFDVTSVDISCVPELAFSSIVDDPSHALHRIPGYSARVDGSVAFVDPGLIDPGLCPAMHRSSEYPNKGGGSVSFVTGDIRQPDVCPGPYDVVIERRVLQLFQGADQVEALNRLVMRLGNQGVLVSHHSMRGRGPVGSGSHYAESHLRSQGFAIHWSGATAELDSAARLAYLIYTTD